MQKVDWLILFCKNSTMVPKSLWRCNEIKFLQLLKIRVKFFQYPLSSGQESILGILKVEIKLIVLVIFANRFNFFPAFFPLKLQSFRLETYSSGIFLNEFWGSPPYPSEFVGDTLACCTELTLSLLGLGLLLMEDMTFPKNPWDAGSSAPSTGGATCTVGAPEIKRIQNLNFFQKLLFSWQSFRWVATSMCVQLQIRTCDLKFVCDLMFF